METKDLPKVVQITGKMKERFGAGTMVVRSGPCVDERMRTVHKGKLTTIDDIGSSIATANRAPTRDGRVAARLEPKGHAVIVKGKRMFVAEYAKKLAKLA